MAPSRLPWSTRPVSFDLYARFSEHLVKLRDCCSPGFFGSRSCLYRCVIDCVATRISSWTLRERGCGGGRRDLLLSCRSRSWLTIGRLVLGVHHYQMAGRHLPDLSRFAFVALSRERDRRGKPTDTVRTKGVRHGGHRSIGESKIATLFGGVGPAVYRDGTAGGGSICRSGSNLHALRRLRLSHCRNIRRAGSAALDQTLGGADHEPNHGCCDAGGGGPNWYRALR